MITFIVLFNQNELSDLFDVLGGNLVPFYVIFSYIFALLVCSANAPPQYSTTILQIF